MEQKIFTCIGETIELFIDKIVEKYPICNREELKILWNSNQDIKTCSHRFTKGKRIGIQCTQRVFDEDDKCSKHKSRPKKDNPSTSSISTKMSNNLKRFEQLNLNLEDSEDSN